MSRTRVMGANQFSKSLKRNNSSYVPFLRNTTSPKPGNAIRPQHSPKPNPKDDGSNLNDDGWKVGCLKPLNAAMASNNIADLCECCDVVERYISKRGKDHTQGKVKIKSLIDPLHHLLTLLLPEGPNKITKLPTTDAEIERASYYLKMLDDNVQYIVAVVPQNIMKDLAKWKKLFADLINDSNVENAPIPEQKPNLRVVIQEGDEQEYNLHVNDPTEQAELSHGQTQRSLISQEQATRAQIRPLPEPSQDAISSTSQVRPSSPGLFNFGANTPKANAENSYKALTEKNKLSGNCCWRIFGCCPPRLTSDDDLSPQTPPPSPVSP